MSQYPNPFGVDRPRTLDYAAPANQAMVRFFNAVYAWMCVGLAVTASVAYMVARSPDLVLSFAHSWFILFIVEIGLVIAITTAVNKISANVATLLFVLFSAVNGLTLSVIFLLYAKSALASAFIISAGTFGAMSAYGMLTKQDLTAMGRIMMMLLLGLVIASVVSLFWHNSAMQVAMNYLGVVVFVALTAYDTQKLKMIAEQTRNDSALAARLSIVGSLVLYLDFINLFLFILRIMGDRRK